MEGNCFRVKRIACLLLVVLTIFVCSCSNDEYVPSIVVDPSLTLNDNVIFGNYVNVYFIEPYELIKAIDDDCNVTLYKDDSYTKHFSGGALELLDGINKYYLLIGTKDKVKEYVLMIDNTLILDFEIIVNEEYVYKINEDFDRTTITVRATKEDGNIIDVTNYNVLFDSSTPGKTKVSIEYGDIVHGFMVDIVD